MRVDAPGIRRMRGRRRVVVTVASAVPATVRVTGRLKPPGRRRALAVRAFAGGVLAGGQVAAELRLGSKGAAALRRRGRATLRVNVVLADASGVVLAQRTLRVRLKR